MIRIGLHAVLLSTVMALPLVAGAAGPRQEVYYIGPTGGLYYADLVEILGHGKVRVARDTGAQTGKASITSLRKDILLDAPLSSFVDGQCADGNWAYQRRDVSRIVYQDSDKGTKPSSSTQWELGTLTNVDGCDIGHVEQFGDLNAPGTAMTHLNMGDNLPSMDGLFGTSRFGGLSDQPWPIDNAPEVDVVAFQSDRTLQFNRTGTTYPTLAVGRWLTFAAPDGEQRGYVRLALVKEWYAEIWLLARFQNGQIVRVLPAPAEHHLPRQRRLENGGSRCSSARPRPRAAGRPGQRQVKLRARKVGGGDHAPAVGGRAHSSRRSTAGQVGARFSAGLHQRRRRAGPGSGPGRPPGAGSARHCRCARCGRRPACARRSGRAESASAGVSPPPARGSRQQGVEHGQALRVASPATGSSALGTHHTSAARAGRRHPAAARQQRQRALAGEALEGQTGRGAGQRGRAHPGRLAGSRASRPSRLVGEDAAFGHHRQVEGLGDAGVHLHARARAHVGHRAAEAAVQALRLRRAHSASQACCRQLTSGRSSAPRPACGTPSSAARMPHLRLRPARRSAWAAPARHAPRDGLGHRAAGQAPSRCSSCTLPRRQRQGARVADTSLSAGRASNSVTCGQPAAAAPPAAPAPGRPGRRRSPPGARRRAEWWHRMGGHGRVDLKSCRAYYSRAPTSGAFQQGDGPWR
jgi:hypothetical protein